MTQPDIVPISSRTVRIDASAEGRMEGSLVEQKYRRMVDRAPIGVYQSTPDGRILTANPALARLLGYDDVSELLSVNLADIYVDPRERQLLIKAFERVGTSAEVEMQWKRKDGRPIFLQVNVHTVLDADSPIVRFEGFVRDVTGRREVERELRQSEERLRLVARATNDAVWDWDIVRNLVWVGDGFQKLFGVWTDEQALRPADSWAERIHPEDRERVVSARFEVVRNGGQFWTDEYRFRRSDGSYAEVYDRGYVLQDAQGQPIRMVGSILDITERKQAERELVNQREQLVALSQRLLQVQETEKRLLARELHDELGQLLTATKLTFQAVQRARTLATTRNKLREGLKLLDQCLKQVRSLSLELRPSLLDDLGLGPALRWYMDRQAARAGFSTRLTDDLGETRLPSELETICFRVAQEAITNIARHAEASTVGVSLDRIGDQVVMVITDDGSGFQVDEARARAAAGGSLGMLGMEERVSLAGGQLEISSRPGAGTAVRVVLPVPPAREDG